MELDQLHSDVIIIMKYCDVKSMLRFSETSKRYNDIMSSNAELTKRIRLNTKHDFLRYCESYQQNLQLLTDLQAIQISINMNQRKYTKLKLDVNYYELLEDASNEEEKHLCEIGQQIEIIRIEIVKAIGKSITEFELNVQFEMSVEDFQRILMSVPNVKKFSLEYLDEDSYGEMFDLGVLSETQLQHLEQQNFNFMATVTELNISDCDANVLQWFRDCRELKSFVFCPSTTFNEQNEKINHFLAQQESLKRLAMSFFEEDKPTPILNLANWTTFSFKLTSLNIAYIVLPASATEFIKQQDQLESLEFTIGLSDLLTYVQQLHNLIKAIFALPKLNFLSIAGEFSLDHEDQSLPDWFFYDLHNDTIKELQLRLDPPFKSFTRLANSVLQAEKISIESHDCVANVSGLQLDVIKKLDVRSAGFLYSPPNIPDREKFEESFTTFMSKNELSYGICIGHPNWLHHRRQFQLSFEFCKMLVDKMHHFKGIELYNVHDSHDELQEYLGAKVDATLYFQPNIIKLHNEEPEAENMDQD